MIVSHSKKFIFVHNYKVAGTSVRRALKPYNHHSIIQSPFGDQFKFLFGVYPWVFSSNFDHHIDAKTLKKQMNPEIFNAYYKFGFVRNPWDWQVSLYKFMLKLETHHQHELVKSFSGFEEYLDWRINEDLHLQKDFFYEDGENLMDYIGKMEDLAENFQEICQKLNINTTLKHFNASREKNDHFSRYYTKETAELVNQAFKEDIELFGYSKPDLS